MSSNRDLGPRRLLILRHGYYPHDVRVRREVNVLQAAGLEVDVVCLRMPGERPTENVSGVSVYRLPIGHRRGSRLRYILEYASSLLLSGIVAARLQLRRRYDLVQVNTMPDLLAFAALGPKLLGARLVLDMHDLMPELYRSRFRVGPGHPVVRLLALQEGLSMRLADLVITVTEEFRRILLERHRRRSGKNIAIVMNCPDESILPRRAPERPHVAGAAEPFVLLSHGVVVERLGYDTMIRAVGLLKDAIPGLELRIIGPGDQEYVDELRKLAADLGVADRVRFTGNVIQDRIPEMVAEADLGVVANRLDGFADLLLPTKLLEYVWLGKPAVVARTPTIANYFDDKMVAFFEPGDERQLAERILELYQQPDRRWELATGATAFFDAHDWRREGEHYREVVEGLIGTPPQSPVPWRGALRTDHAGTSARKR